MKRLWHEFTWIWHAMFCKMPGWEVPVSAQIAGPMDKLDWVRCKGCLHQTLASGHEIAAILRREREKNLARLAQEYASRIPGETP